MKTVHLHGALAEQYGTGFELSVVTPAEAIRALFSQLKGFEADIREGSWICVRGDEISGYDCDLDMLHLHFGKVKDFHIIPAAIGRKSGGIGKIIMGVLLIAAVVFTAGIALGGIGAFGAVSSTFGLGTALSAGFWGASLFGVNLATAALVGGGLMILGGAAQAIATVPGADYNSREEADKRPGYLFNGPINTSEQGGPVPIVVGRIRAGSVVVSAGISTERLAVISDVIDPPPPDPTGVIVYTPPPNIGPPTAYYDPETGNLVIVETPLPQPPNTN